jgi:hypothetical protein
MCSVILLLAPGCDDINSQRRLAKNVERHFEEVAKAIEPKDRTPSPSRETDLRKFVSENTLINSVSIPAYLNITNIDELLAQLPALKLSNHVIVSLEGTRVTDEGLKHLRGTPVKTLDLTDTAITDAGLSYLNDLPLRKLKLNSTHVTDAGMDILMKIPTLRELNVSGTAVSEDKALEFADLNVRNGIQFSRRTGKARTAE